jgi:hypothetical protein
MFLPSDIRKMLALLRGQISPVLAGIAVGLGLAIRDLKPRSNH